MITIQSDLLVKKHIEASDFQRPYLNAAEALRAIHTHLAPLGESANSVDSSLYVSARNSLAHLAEAYQLGDIFSLGEEIDNWTFLNTLAFCWKDCAIADRSYQGVTARDLSERLTIENVGVRALSRNEVIFTNLFKDQTHFSIYGADLILLRKTLREVLGERRKLTH